MDDITDNIERRIDSWLYDMLDEEVPRNSYIYHCNLAYIDILIDQKILFTPFEKHYLFSLSYNTHIAHLKLKEESVFDYRFNRKMYAFAFNMVIRGMQYSMLCDIFPLLHSKKATMQMLGNDIKFDVKKLPKKNFKYIEDYSIRKALSYTLQIANGKLQNSDDESIAMQLSNIYTSFWNENMLYEDYEPYTRLDWGGINGFFNIACMRRFNMLYKKDFDVVSLDSQKMMVICSPDGVKRIREYVPATDEELYKLALEDQIYKPVGKGVFPKLNISEAPLNRTSDGYIFANPLVILFNDSPETQLLNYLRKCDNSRYLRIKDKIKERVIPLICEMMKYKFPLTIAIPNFHIKIPLQGKNRRECDLLLVDENGIAIYLEIKHFYYPQSFCETKKVDAEFTKSLGKMPDQLNAIRYNWEAIKQTYKVSCDLSELYGIIVSHRYTGFDVQIDEVTPIVNSATLYESIGEAESLKDIYLGCKEIDNIYPSIRFIERDMPVNFAGFTFHLKAECLDPLFEIQFIKSYRKQINDSLSSTTSKSFRSISDLAHGYIDAFQFKS